MFRRSGFYLIFPIISLLTSHLGLIVGPGIFRISIFLFITIFLLTILLFVALYVFEKKNRLLYLDYAQILYSIFILLIFYISGISYENLKLIPNFGLTSYFLQNLGILYQDAFFAFSRLGFFYHLWFISSAVACFYFIPKIDRLFLQKGRIGSPTIPILTLLIVAGSYLLLFSDKLVSNPNKMVLDRFSRSNSNTKPQRNKNIIIFLLEGISKEAFTKVDLSSFKNWEEIEYFFVPIPHSSNSLFSLITGNYSDSRREPNSENTKSAQPITSEFERAGYKIRFLFSGAGYFENIQRMMQDWRIPLYDRNYFRNNAKKNYKEFQWGLEDSVLIDFASDFSQLDPSPYLYILYFTNTHSPYFNPHPEKFYRFEEDSDYGRYLNSLEYELHLVDSFVRKNEDRFPNQTIYLLLSDHGESFGKFGVYKHGFSIKNEEVRVPFLYYSPEFSIPSAEKGGIHDVFPSLLELLDFGSYKEKNGTSFFDPDYEFRMPLYPWGPRSSKGVLYKDKKYILEENSRSLIESDLDESEMKESRDPNILKLLQKL